MSIKYVDIKIINATRLKHFNKMTVPLKAEASMARSIYKLLFGRKIFQAITIIIPTLFLLYIDYQ